MIINVIIIIIIKIITIISQKGKQRMVSMCTDIVDSKNTLLMIVARFDARWKVVFHELASYLRVELHIF
jgi:hypothetical protein